MINDMHIHLIDSRLQIVIFDNEVKMIITGVIITMVTIDFIVSYISCDKTRVESTETKEPRIIIKDLFESFPRFFLTNVKEDYREPTANVIIGRIEIRNDRRIIERGLRIIRISINDFLYLLFTVGIRIVIVLLRKHLQIVHICSRLVFLVIRIDTKNRQSFFDRINRADVICDNMMIKTADNGILTTTTFTGDHDDRNLEEESLNKFLKGEITIISTTINIGFSLNHADVPFIRRRTMPFSIILFKFIDRIITTNEIYVSDLINEIILKSKLIRSWIFDIGNQLLILLFFGKREVTLNTIDDQIANRLFRICKLKLSKIRYKIKNTIFRIIIVDLIYIFVFNDIIEKRIDEIFIGSILITLLFLRSNLVNIDQVFILIFVILDTKKIIKCRHNSLSPIHY